MSENRRGPYRHIEKFLAKLYPRYENDGYPAPEEHWQYDAECSRITGVDPITIFFPTRFHQDPSNGVITGRPEHEQYKEARQYCYRCPVQKDCLEAAIREERMNPHGMRGGLTPKARKQLYYDRCGIRTEYRSKSYKPKTDAVIAVSPTHAKEQINE